MLHFIRDCLFRSDSPLHHEFSNSLERFIAECIARRKSKWFPCMFHDLRSLRSTVSEVQAKHVQLEQRIDALQIFLCLWLSGAEFVVHVSAEVWLALGVFEGEERTGIVRFW